MGKKSDSREEKGGKELTPGRAADAMSHQDSTSETSLCTLHGGLEDQGTLKLSFDNTCNSLLPARWDGSCLRNSTRLGRAG